MASLDLNKAMAILISMDPNKAADVLTEMGAPQAATKLVLMEADARNSILESMAPRAAANTLTSMEDALVALQEEAAARQQQQQQDGGGGDGNEPASPQMLTLSGGPSGLPGSPVMGAMAELDPTNAYSIMSYMSVKDKAALLATMEPEAVARLLGCMDPHEAVLLLAALGDGSGALVGACLSAEERDRLVQVLTSADCAPAAQRRAASGRRRGGSSKKYVGSFRKGAAQGTMERLVGAYEAIEAVAMNGGDDDNDGGDDVDDGGEGGEDEGAQAAAGQAGRAAEPGTSGKTAGRRATKQQQQQQQQAPARRAPQDAGSKAAGGAGEAAAAQTSGASGRAPDPAAASGGSGSDEELGEDGEGERDAVPAAAPAAGAPGSSTRGKQGAARPAGTRAGAGAAGKRGAGAPAAVATARERRVSTSSQVEAEHAPPPDASAAAVAAQKRPGGSKPGAGAAGPAAPKTRRGARGSDAADGPAAAAAAAAASGSGTGGRRGSIVGDSGVPALQLQGRDSSSGASCGELTPPGSSHRTRRLDDAEHSAVSEEAAGASGDSTPRVQPGGAAAAGAAAAAARGGAGGRGAPAAARNAAAGRRALREALKTQAAAKKVAAAGPAGGGPSGTHPGNGGAATHGAGSGTGAAAATGDAADAGGASGTGGGGAGSLAAAAAAAAAPPQVKLGRVPKNARLIEAMAQHKNAKPKPRGWLMAVVDSIYKEGEALLRKLGRADMIKKQSVPEIVFAYFHNKYGQRALVNENVGSLVNTLSLYQHTDLRLEAFARQLSEEWDVSIFLDFLVAQNMCLQPSKVACIDYPREAGKDEQYPWVCLWRAVWVADAMLGARAQAAREHFNEFLQLASVPADGADVERLRREAATKPAGGGGADAAAAAAQQQQDLALPDRFYKLPRIRFLLLLSKEILRINRFITTFGEDRFAAMDVQRSGRLGIVAVRGFVKSLSPGASDGQVAEHIGVFVATAEAAARDVPPEQVAVAAVTELGRDAFVAGVSGTAATRDHIKMHLLPPARLEEEDGESQVFFSLLGVLITRHAKALLPTWGAAAAAAQRGGGGALQQQLAAVEAANAAADARLKAYVGLLLGLINVSVQGYVEGVLGQAPELDAAGSDELEAGLLRLEDAALVLVCGCRYLLALDDGGGNPHEPSSSSPSAAGQEGKGGLALARMARLPLGAQISAMGAELLTHRRMQEGMVGNAAAVLQRVWRARQRQRQQRAQQQQQ